MSMAVYVLIGALLFSITFLVVLQHFEIFSLINYPEEAAEFAFILPLRKKLVDLNVELKSEKSFEFG
jgi:hypothetical protein